MVLFVLFFVLFIFPLPYFYRAPGEVIPASSIVDVEKGIKKHKGKFFITTLISHQANLILVLNHFFKPDSRILPISLSSSGKLQAEAGPDPYDILRKESNYRAKLYAMQKLGYSIPVRFDGAQVTAHLPGSKSRKILKPGDIIIDIDGYKVAHQKHIHLYTNANIDKKKKFKVTFIRDGKKITADIIPIRDKWGRASLGTYFQTRLKRFKMPVYVEIKGGDFSGSSGGLPLFLEIIHQMRKDDLAHGKKIAASGELSEMGTIKPVVGIEFKIKGAEEAGCEYFLCSPGNYKKANKAAKTLKVLGVRNINEAIDVLEELK